MSNKQKIILYNPLSSYFDMPLALLALGSSVNKSLYEVIIIDARIEKDAHNKVLKEAVNALCFGVTVLTGKPIEDAVLITQKVKKKYPELPTIWGGWHPSIFPESTLIDEKSIDITVQGQGEFTFRELIDSFTTGKPLSEVDGICYRNEKNEVIKNPARPMIDMNNTSIMDYNLIDVEAYFNRKGRRQLDYISSIGCTNRCAFCADPFVFKRKFSALDSQRMVDEIENLYKTYSFTDINFQDETFFTYPKRILSFANELIKRNIKIGWTATMRADQGHRLKQEDFDILARSGLTRLLIGVESGSQEIMDKLNKDIKKEQVVSTAEKCKKSGIRVQFPFIVGIPEESDKNFEESIEFSIELLMMSKIFTTAYFYFKPYPGTLITEEAVSKGFIIPHTLHEWINFDFHKTEGIWISKDKIKKIEELKFYVAIAVSRNRLAYLFKGLARYRLRKRWFGFSFEKVLYSLIKREEKYPVKIKNLQTD
jgi:anaerobic magnesium-protoporphyrin IX monomethyl ester cyclase